MKNYARGIKTRNLIMGYIKSYIKLHGYAPSNKEIADAIKLSPSVLWNHMKILLEQGEIETDLTDRWHTSRAYRLRKETV